MDPEQMKERGVVFNRRLKGILKNYKLEFNKVSNIIPGAVFANIELEEDEIVEGILYDISEADILKLDQFEKFPDHYEKIWVDIYLNNSTLEKAIAYIAHLDMVKNGLKPSREYIDHLLKGCDCLSEDYCNKLRSIKTFD